MAHSANRWSKEDIEYLLENYSTATTYEISKHLKRSYESIAAQAFRFGLKKKKGVKGKKPKQQAYDYQSGKFREETEMMADIICFMKRRGLSEYSISAEVKCPVEQVEQILERCMEDGSYERYAKQENAAMTGIISTIFDFSSCKPASKVGKNKSAKSERMGSGSVQGV